MKELQIIKDKKFEIEKHKGSIDSDSIPIYFTKDETLRFFNVIPPGRDKVFFMILLGTGKRISEILSVKRKDVDIENERMRISLVKKRKKSTQFIKIHKELMLPLVTYIASMLADDQIFGFTRQQADKLTKKYAKESGITYKRTSCHIFRHTFAVRWLEQGKDIVKLQHHLGHNHITTTMVYLRIVNKDYEETVDSLDMKQFFSNV